MDCRVADRAVSRTATHKDVRSNLRGIPHPARTDFPSHPPSPCLSLLPVSRERGRGNRFQGSINLIEGRGWTGRDGRECEETGEWTTARQAARYHGPQFPTTRTVSRGVFLTQRGPNNRERLGSGLSIGNPQALPFNSPRSGIPVELDFFGCRPSFSAANINSVALMKFICDDGYFIVKPGTDKFHRLDCRAERTGKNG
jgi:hypothetical protein